MHQVRIFVVLSLLGISTNLLACSCKTPLLTDEINESKAIFIGKVTGTEEFNVDFGGYPEKYQRATFQLIESLKGNQSALIEVITEIGSSCGMTFHLDSTYLVFASNDYYYDTFQDELTTGLCSRTRPFSRSETVLNKLYKLGNKIEIIDELDPNQLYGEIWKEELFFSVEQYEKLLLSEEEETELVLNLLPNCETDSIFPVTKEDSTRVRFSSWNYKPTRVSVFFEIDPNGLTSNFKVLGNFDKVSEECIEVAKDFVSKLGPWKPAEILGINVRSVSFYEVDFALLKSR